jgi:hypothetical protein
MTTIPADAPYTLRVQWLQYDGGPAANVTDVTITITRLSDVTVIVGPNEDTGVTHIATGLDVYSWTPDPDAAGDFTVVWDGTDVASSDLVQSVPEIITVGIADVTNDPTTVVGKIRLLISDTDPDNPAFTDTQITAFYTISGSNVRLGAAAALDALAASEVLISKAIKTLDLETNGPAVAAELRNQAKTLRVTAGDYDADGNLFGMAIVDFRPDRWFDHELAEPGWCP